MISYLRFMADSFGDYIPYLFVSTFVAAVALPFTTGVALTLALAYFVLLCGYFFGVGYLLYESEKRIAAENERRRVLRCNQSNTTFNWTNYP